MRTWGYPYVLDEFGFHLTLTDRIPREQRPAVERVLGDWFAELLGADLPVDALGVFTEAEPGAPFELTAVHHLQPAPRGRVRPNRQLAKELDEPRNGPQQRPDRP